MAVRDINDLTKEELIDLYISDQKVLQERIRELTDRHSSEKKILQEKIGKLTKNLEAANRNLSIVMEKYNLLMAAKYQSQKKIKIKGYEQLAIDLFNDAEDGASDDEDESEVTIVREHRRRTSKKKEISYDDLEQEVMTLEPSEEDRICDKCGSKMKIKGYEEKKELVYIPAKLILRITKIPIMECEHCQEESEDGRSTYKTACEDRARKVIPGSVASPELLAHIITQKYDTGVPLYTLERTFAQDGVTVPRANMSNWLLYIGRYFKPLYDLMMGDLKKNGLIHADETYTQVIKEPGRDAQSTSYMWVFRSGEGYTPVVLYYYAPTRSGDIPKSILDGWTGLLETDAYKGYGKVEGALRCLCNVHALRKFKDAFSLIPKGSPDRKESDEAKAVAGYQKIFNVEHRIQDEADRRSLKDSERFAYIREQRISRIRPLFERYVEWLEGIKTYNAGKSTMTKAIDYVLNNKEGLMRFIDYGNAPISNQIAEQSIRPFVVIRNRCRFHFSMAGAETSAMIYSLMITAKENGRHPYGYFEYILEKLPGMDLENEEELRKLLPYSEELPYRTKKFTRKEREAILRDGD